MKAMKYFVLSLAVGLFTFACSKSNTNENPIDPNPKNVSLKLQDVLQAKSVDDTVSDGTIVGINNLRILLTDGTSIFHDISLVSGSTGYNNAIDGTGYLIESVNPLVTKAIVLGNSVGENITYTSEATVKNAVMQADIEQDNSNVLCFGEANLVAATPPSASINYYYTANVTIAPLVARMEISKIECSDLGTYFSSFDMIGVGLVDFRQHIKIDGSDVATKLPAYDGTIGYIYETGTTGPVGGYEFGVNSSILWAYDAISANNHFTSSVKYHYANDDASKAWAYQFIPMVGELPNVKLRLNNVTQINGQPTNVSWVSTKQFSGVDLATHPMKGYVYRFNMVFKESNIGTYIPGANIGVEVFVTVETWKVRAIVPEFY